MKAWFERFRNRAERAESDEDLMALVHPVWHRINQTVSEVVLTHREFLKDKDIDYLTAAVWGQHAVIELDRSQCDIYRFIQPVVRDVIGVLGNDKHSQSQFFTIEFLIRGLIVTRIAFGIESYKLALMKRDENSTGGGHELPEPTPMGRA